MRYRATFISALSVLLLSTVPAAKSAERGLLTRIPVEYQGRWVMSLDQCDAPAEGWLYISDLSFYFREGQAYIVSARRIDDLKLEVDVSLWEGWKSREDWRQVRLFTLSRDRHTLTESRSDSSSIVRVRCD